MSGKIFFKNLFVPSKFKTKKRKFQQFMIQEIQI